MHVPVRELEPLRAVVLTRAEAKGSTLYRPLYTPTKAIPTSSSLYPFPHPFQVPYFLQN